MFNLVALMPMRHSSSRVEGKNYREFGDGRPLFYHVLEKLINCSEIDKVVINTDSELIFELCKIDFPEVIVLNRPDYLKGEDCPMNDILLYDVEKIKSKFYIQTHSTNPLLTSSSLKNSLKVFRENYPKYDSLFSVTKKQARYWDQTARPINHDVKILKRTQDLPPIYEENSCIYIFGRENLIKNRNRIGNVPFLYEIDSIESIDIDEEIDFQLAEKIFQLNQK